MYLKFGKPLQVLVDRGQRLAVVVAELDFLPEVLRRVRALDRFHEQKDLPLLLLDRGVAAVGQGARAAVAEPRDIVFVSAERLLLLRLRLERTVVLVDHLPDDLIVLHRYRSRPPATNRAVPISQ